MTTTKRSTFQAHADISSEWTIVTEFEFSGRLQIVAFRTAQPNIATTFSLPLGRIERLVAR